MIDTSIFTAFLRDAADKIDRHEIVSLRIDWPGGENARAQVVQRQSADTMQISITIGND